MSKIDTDFVVCSVPELNGTKYNTKTAHEVVTSCRAAFDTGKTKPVEFRRNQLKQLLCMLEDNTDAFVQVLNEDLGRSRHETITYDLDVATNEIKRILYNLDDWIKPTHPSKTLVFMADALKIVNDPYGVVLIIGSWNYPLSLTLSPFAGAISAGNCVIVKPSEVSNATSELVATLIPKYLDATCYQVYQGGVAETTDLLEQKFDYIFFTGSTKVGRIVHAAATKSLTPVTLELGGKSPVYIDNTADLLIAVRRIFWGKCANAGQTCIAPDYVLCSEDVQKKMIPIAKQVLKEWYGDDIKASPHYPRIISDVHFNRLVDYLGDRRNIALGGQVDPSQRFIEPTILINVSLNHPVMLDEIFGPILPIVIVKDIQEAVSFINAGEKPLALYVFTKKKSVKDFFIDKTSSGGVVVNDTLVHYAAATELPFGGVGQSGMGKYHAKDSFDTFVHKKSVLEKTFNPLFEKVLSIRYPPYSSTKTNLLRNALRTRRGFCVHWLVYLFVFCLGIVFMICLQVIYYKATNKTLI